MQWLKANNMQIHWWIWIYGLITIAGSAVGIISGLGRFEMFYGAALAGLDPTHPVVAHLGGMWASKNIGYVTALVIGFALRKPWILAPIFGMKFVNDTVDMFIVGPQHLDQHFAQVFTGWLILVRFVAPALVIIVLLQKVKILDADELFHGLF